ncbi:nucleobase:cation symporter-2 family protein [Risungbinella massiliensis]|uniref:nucleobase:cation symporter-2 family protein n=1 Tax=Risungbinella massiliensis TaxID=1329796 RepID=UPI0005CBEF6A|nr:nucleobase:cation symporter-2 family protein [Risungbinella massiliensis]
MKSIQTKELGRTSLLGFQHVLAMYAGAVVVPLIVGAAVGLTQEQLAYLIAIDLFTSGIASLLQVMGGKHFGIKLPVILGCTFTAVGPMIAIGKVEGVAGIYGSIIASGIVVMIVAQFFGKILQYFPPVVIGSVVTTIGVSLVPVAMTNVAGGDGSPTFGHLENLFLALFTFLCVILLQRFTKGFLQAISVLIALVMGSFVAYLMGLVDLSVVGKADWFSMVRPFYFGAPEFHLSSIITMSLVAIVSMVESTGVFLALSEVCEKKLAPTDIKRGLRAEGLAVVIGGLFNAFPYTTFSQNVGLVAMTKVKKRSVVIAAGVILMILGLLPKVAAITTIIPNAVLGGAMIPMFGMVVASGIRLLSTVDFKRNENLLIVACSVGIGLGSAVVPAVFTEVPESLKVIVENGIVLGSFTAFFLNLLLNKKQQETTITTEQTTTS